MNLDRNENQKLLQLYDLKTTLFNFTIGDKILDILLGSEKLTIGFPDSSDTISQMSSSFDRIFIIDSNS